MPVMAQEKMYSRNREGDGAEVGEHRVHPDDPEHAGAHDDDDGGDDAAPNSTGGGNAGVHQGADAEGKAHDLQPLHTGGDHVRLIGEKSKELVSEQQQQSAADAAHQKGIQQNDTVALEDTIRLSGTPVAADKGGAAGIEGRHHIEDQRIGVGSCRATGYHHRIEAVDADLYEEVCNGKDGVLQAGGDADHQHPLGGGLVDAQLFQMHSAGILLAHQMPHDQQSGQPLGDGAGGGHTEGGHVALDHKEQVQGHIHHAGNAQIQQRPLCVPGGTEDTIAEVVYRHGRHTQSVDPQIPHGAGQQLLLGIQQQQHIPLQMSREVWMVFSTSS